MTGYIESVEKQLGPWRGTKTGKTGNSKNPAKI